MVVAGREGGKGDLSNETAELQINGTQWQVEGSQGICPIVNSQ